mgnify:CR=1 FL=1
MKTVKLFRFTNTNNNWGSEMVFGTWENAKMNLKPHWGGQIEEFEGHIFETGDKIEVELHTGARYTDDEESISSGGKWNKVIGLVKVDHVMFGIPEGFLLDENGKFLQSMIFVCGIKAAQFKNAKIAAA